MAVCNACDAVCHACTAFIITEGGPLSAPGLGCGSREQDQKFGMQPCIYLEGQGGVSRFIRGIIEVTIWVVGVINLLTKSP